MGNWGYNPTYNWIRGPPCSLSPFYHSSTPQQANSLFSQLSKEKEARPAAMILLQMEWLDAWPCKGKSYLSSSRLAPPNFYRVDPDMKFGMDWFLVDKLYLQRWGYTYVTPRETRTQRFWNCVFVGL